jgi:RimJ/RimL family protein N-acetyltransferase
LFASIFTSRLQGERLGEEHFADLLRMSQDPRVMATLGGRLLSEAETREMLDRHLAHWKSHGYGAWAFRDKIDGAFIGRAGLRNIDIEGRPETELHYALCAEYWGKGLATEIAQALVSIAFEQLDLPDVVSFTLPTNRASQRVMEKAGFRYERDFVHHDMPHVFYRINRPMKTLEE